MALIENLHIDDKTQIVKQLGGKDFIKCFLHSNTIYDIKIGDYTIFKGSNYYVNTLPNITKAGTNKYKYEINLERGHYDLKKVQFRNGDRGDFHYVGNAEDLVDLIITNMNRVYSGYTKGTVKSTDVKLFHFSGESCLAVIQRLCTKFDGEFSLTGKTLKFVDSIGSDTGLTFEYKVGLHNIKRETTNPENLVTKLYVFGSERNIASDYRSSAKRLMFEVASKSYIEDYTYTTKVIEKTKIFDDIYPHRDGTISWVDGSNILKFKDDGMDFNLNDYLLPGITAKVSFKTGNLSGYEFEVSAYDNATKQFTIIAFKDKQGLELPNATLKPAVSDTYVLIDIKLPASYITTAETALYDKAVLYLADNSKPKVNYVVTADRHYFETNAVEVDIGDQATITDTDLGASGKFRIVELTRSYCYPYNYTLKFDAVDYTPSLPERLTIDNEDEKKELFQINRDWTEKTLLLNKIIRIEDGKLTLNADTTVTGDFKVGSSNLDETVIAGGKIITGLLTADNIKAGTLLIAYTQAKCTDPNADQTATHTAANAANYTGQTIATNYTAAKCTDPLADRTLTHTAKDIVNLPSTPSGAGLYADPTHLGYYSGSLWMAYIDSSGNFYFKGNDNNYISWGGSLLDIKAKLLARDDSQIAGWLVSGNQLKSASDEILFDSSNKKIYVGGTSSGHLELYSINNYHQRLALFAHHSGELIDIYTGWAGDPQTLEQGIIKLLVKDYGDGTTYYTTILGADINCGKNVLASGYINAALGFKDNGVAGIDWTGDPNTLSEIVISGGIITDKTVA